MASTVTNKQISGIYDDILRRHNVAVLNATRDQLVNRARDLLLDAMSSPVDEWSQADQLRVNVAKWVLSHRSYLDN